MSKVNADGLCLLNAFKSCLLHDFGEIISISSVKEKVTSFVCDNAEQYVGFHTESADALLEDVQKFFETKVHDTSDICDMLIRFLLMLFKLA